MDRTKKEWGASHVIEEDKVEASTVGARWTLGEI